MTKKYRAQLVVDALRYGPAVWIDKKWFGPAPAIHQKEFDRLIEVARGVSPGGSVVQYGLAGVSRDVGYAHCSAAPAIIFEIKYPVAEGFTKRVGNVYTICRKCGHKTERRIDVHYEPEG